MHIPVKAGEGGTDQDSIMEWTNHNCMTLNHRMQIGYRVQYGIVINGNGQVETR